MKEDHQFEPMQGSLGNELTPCKHCGYARASIVHTNREVTGKDVDHGFIGLKADPGVCVICGFAKESIRHLSDPVRVVMSNDATKGLKYDASKPRYDLLPPTSLEWIAQVLTYGAQKYSPDNWRKVDGWRWRYFSAAMRHMWAWQRGERYDRESSLPHLAHALCCLMFMLDLDVAELPPEARKP